MSRSNKRNIKETFRIEKGKMTFSQLTSGKTAATRVSKMAAVNTRVATSVNIIKRWFGSLSLGANKHVNYNIHQRLLAPVSYQCSNFHTSFVKQDLMEFFDDKKNWGENEVKVGRSWKTDELRIKSNADLHKLWFVLLKEHNMLLTMEHECKEAVHLFPSPERLDKVKESMKNLEDVVRERNRAYFELETGETGERPGKLVTNALGMHFFYKMREHHIPKFMNHRWHQTHQFGYRGTAVRKFLKLYREKLFLAKKKAANREKGHVMGLIKRYPHLDSETLSQHYPNVDVEKVRTYNKTRGHHDQNEV